MKIFACAVLALVGLSIPAQACDYAKAVAVNAYANQAVVVANQHAVVAVAAPVFNKVVQTEVFVPQVVVQQKVVQQKVVNAHAVQAQVVVQKQNAVQAQVIKQKTVTKSGFGLFRRR